MDQTQLRRRERRAGRWWSCLAAALSVSACGVDGSGSAEPVQVTVPPDAVHSLTGLDVVTRVVDLQPTGDGRVWVLNSTAPFFIVVGPNGQVEREFGDEGGGPQEFRGPVALVDGPEPTDAWVYDVPRNALVQVSTEQRRELALPRDTMPAASLISFQGLGITPAAPWLESTEAGFLLARTRISDPETALRLWQADILLLREDGLGVDPHTPIANLLGDPESRFPAATTLLPYPLWSVCGDGTVGLYDPLANTLRRFTDERQELEALVLPEERRLEITVDNIFDIFYRRFAEDVPSGQLPPKEELRRVVEEQNRELVGTSAGVFPEYSDLRCSGDGTFWLRRFDIAVGRLGMGADWLRFAPDGSLTFVALPRDFRAYRIERDRMWGMVKDSLGFETISWIQLDALH